MTASNLGEQAQTREAIEFLSSAATQLATAKDVHSLAQALCDVLSRLISVHYFGIFFIDPETGELTLPVAVNFTEEERREALRTALERHPGHVIRTGQTLHIPDVEADTEGRSRSSRRSFAVRSRLWMAVKGQTGNVGAIGMASTEPHAFSELHVSVVEFACYLASVMYRNIADNLELVKQLDRVRRQELELRQLSSPVIEVWVRILALPLIGYIDAARTALIGTNLLAAVVERRAHTVILDFTGAEVLDGAGAERLMRLCAAVAMLGARCLFSGISPSLAVRLSAPGHELGANRSFSTLQQALAFAMKSR